eukprot:5979231-Ditylum_brightwellii.AAC.1
MYALMSRNKEERLNESTERLQQLQLEQDNIQREIQCYNKVYKLETTEEDNQSRQTSMVTKSE